MDDWKKKYGDKKVFVVTKNERFYSGKVLDFVDNKLELLTVKGFASIDKNDVSEIKEEE